MFNGCSSIGCSSVTIFWNKSSQKFPKLSKKKQQQFLVKNCVFKNLIKSPSNLGYFCKKICHQQLSKSSNLVALKICEFFLSRIRLVVVVFSLDDTAFKQCSVALVAWKRNCSVVVAGCANRWKKLTVFYSLSLPFFSVQSMFKIWWKKQGASL